MKKNYRIFIVLLVLVLGVGIKFAWDFPSNTLGINLLNSGIFIFSFLAVVCTFNFLINNKIQSKILAIPCFVLFISCVALRFILY